MFGPNGNPTAANLFHIVACLQEHEGVRLQVVAQGLAARDMGHWEFPILAICSIGRVGRPARLV